MAPTASVVHAAVAAGQSAEQVRRVINDCAQGGGAAAEPRAADAPAVVGRKKETPIAAAQRQGRGDLVGVLLEAGADPGVFHEGGGKATPLALACAYGAVDSVRALLAAGHDVNEPFAYDPHQFVRDEPSSTCAHVCILPPLIPPLPRGGGKPSFDVLGVKHPDNRPPPQLACLAALAEGGANLNAGDGAGRTPIHWAIHANKTGRVAALEHLIRLGANVNTGDKEGDGAMEKVAQYGNLEMLNMLLAAGAEADTWSGDGGFTPLQISCMNGHYDMALVLLKASNQETRRNADSYDGMTAADAVIANEGRSLQPMHLELIAGVLEAGGRFNKKHAAVALPAVLARARASSAGEATRMKALAARLQKMAEGGDDDEDDGADY